jgi:hypothetical protein
MYLARYFYKNLFIEISKFDCLGFRSKKKMDIGQILVEKNKVNKIPETEVEAPGPEMGLEVKTSTRGWFDFLNDIDYIYWGKVVAVVASTAILIFTIYKIFSGSGGLNGSDGCNPNKPPYVHYHCHKNHANPSVTEYTSPGSNIKNVYLPDPNYEANNTVIQEMVKLESCGKPTLLKNSETLVNTEASNIGNDNTSTLLEQVVSKDPVNILPKLSLRGTLEKKLSETSINIDSHSMKPQIGELNSLLNNSNYFYKEVADPQIADVTYGEVGTAVKSVLSSYQLMLDILKNDSNIKQNFILNQNRKEFLNFIYSDYSPKLQNLFLMCIQSNATIDAITVSYNEMQFYTSKFIKLFKPSLNEFNQKKISKLLEYSDMDMKDIKD